MLFVNETAQFRRFAAIIPCGASGAEYDRLDNLTASLLDCEPLVSAIVIVDDAADAPPLRVALPRACRLMRIVNPRAGRGEGSTGGLCAGVLEGFRACVESFSASIDFVIKLDTDALVIAPFAEKLFSLFQGNRRAGMVGAHLRTPNGDLRDFSCWTQLVRDISRLWLWDSRRRRRAGRSFPLACWGAPAQMRAVIRSAIRSGYAPGDNCLGGAYAISTNALASIFAAGHLDHPLLWLATALGEDILMSLLVRGVGFDLLDFCADNQVFGIRHIGLPDSPVRLLERGFSIIHSTKNATVCESELRDCFREYREGKNPQYAAAKSRAQDAQHAHAFPEWLACDL